jgi:hypothetical protein
MFSRSVIWIWSVLLFGVVRMRKADSSTSFLVISGKLTIRPSHFDL